MRKRDRSGIRLKIALKRHDNIAENPPIRASVQSPTINQPIPIEFSSASQSSSNINNSNVFILAGPGGYAFNRVKVLNTEKAFNQAGANTMRLGDGEVALASADVDNLLSHIAATTDSKRIFLYIQAHGEVDEETSHHKIHLSNQVCLETRELFDKLKKIGKPIDIFSLACHGGAAHDYAQAILPAGSTYVSLAPGQEVVSGSDVDRLIKILLSEAVVSHDITAEQLAILYLTKALENRIPPLISTEKSSFPLKEHLLGHIGHKFSAAEKLHVYNYLEPLISRTKLDALMSKIETSKDEWSINAKEFGSALAICHVARGRMLSEKSSFELSQKDSVEQPNRTQQVAIKASLKTHKQVDETGPELERDGFDLD